MLKQIKMHFRYSFYMIISYFFLIFSVLTIEKSDQICPKELFYHYFLCLFQVTHLTNLLEVYRKLN